MISGRQKEQAILQRLFSSNRAEFLAVYGRRRIGKTFLIHEFFKDKGVYFEVIGQSKSRKNDQLKSFYKEFRGLFPEEAQKAVPEDWSDALDLLLKAIMKIDPSRKCIIFLDELPWLASPRSGFLSALDYVWNRHLSRLSNVLLIVCGSSAGWMIKKVVNDKGGLHGRLSCTIRLLPFSLGETEKFLIDQGVHIKRKQLIEIYMAVGGIAKYLMNVPLAKSSAQVINEMCFSSQGVLFAEFHKLYESLFEHSEKHIMIVRALAKKRRGMFQEELLQETNIAQGGGAVDILNELEQSGFIMSIPSFGKQVKGHKFRLMDEYSLFYLTWIEEIKSSVLRDFDKEYWNKMRNKPAWYAWAGYVFENICLKHSGKIKDYLGISGITTKESHWQHFAGKGSDEQGAEIDLVIDRADDCINLCEIKFCDDVFEIDRNYAKVLEQKKVVFQKVTGTRKTIFLTIITPYGVKENEHYIGLVNQQIMMDALF